MLMLYKGLIEARNLDFANEFFSCICSTSCAILPTSCELIFNEHNAPIFVDLYPTAFRNETIITKKKELDNIYLQVIDGNVVLIKNRLMLHLPEELRNTCKDFLNLMYVVKNDLGESVLFDLYRGLSLNPIVIKEAITKYCQWCGDVFDRNEEYLHKHFAEHLRIQIAFGMFSHYTEFMTEEDVVLFENYMTNLIKKGIKEADIGQAYINLVKEKMSK